MMPIFRLRRIITHEAFLEFSHISIFYFLALVAFLLYSTTTSAASFKCNESKTSVEKAICFDPNLSKLDELMKAEYDKIRTDITRRKELFNTQRDWRNLVRNQCTTFECIRLSYTTRIEQLRSGNLADWANGTTVDSVFSVMEKNFGYFAAPSNLEWAKQWITDRKLLEVAVANMSIFTKLRSTLSIIAASCPGQANAFYLSSRDRIVLCYELVNEIVKPFSMRIYNKESSEADENDRFFKALEYILMHEFGHAILHSNTSILSLGSPETEADNFASVMLIKKYRTSEEQNQLLWGVWTFHNHSAKSSYKFEEYADEHDVAQQRLAKFACNLAGANPIFYTHLKSSGLLTPNIRQDACRASWLRNSATVAHLSR